MAAYSRADQKSWDGLQKDMIGSINAMFEKAHLVGITNANGSAFIRFDYVQDGSVHSEEMRVSEKIFKVK